LPKSFETHTEILPASQREIWPRLAPAAALSFVLYGGTAVALHLGHRTSVDFDFFRTEPLEKAALRRALPFLTDSSILQDEADTLAVSVATASGPVRLAFFGGIGFGRVGEPLYSDDGIQLVASLDDLLATKLKTILDRAEARDYSDIAAMLRNGASLEFGLGAFKAMFKGEPAAVLRALGFFEDGDLRSLAMADRDILVSARDRVRDVPAVPLVSQRLSP
jgi:Nucleotidyl transferase AbiEii toxin, Type IV TA system